MCKLVRNYKFPALNYKHEISYLFYAEGKLPQVYIYSLHIIGNQW